MANGLSTEGLDRNDTRHHIILSVVWTIVPFAMLTVGLRMYCRGIMRKNLGPDDYMACVSMLLVFIVGCLMTIMTRNGEGMHLAFLSDDEFRYYKKLFYVDIIFYIAALYSIKMHVLMQYLRLFEIKMRKVTIWVMVVVGLYGVASVFCSIFFCVPVASFWDERVPGVCIPTMPNWYTNAVGNIITDIVVFGLPLRILWQLRLSRATRISLIAVFSLGFFTVCLSMVRLTFLNIHGNDQTYNNPTIGAWTISELCCGIIVSCAPTLRPLLNRLFPALLGSSADPSGQGNAYIRTFGGGKYDHEREREIELAKASKRASSGRTPLALGSSDTGAPVFGSAGKSNHLARGSSSTAELTQGGIEGSERTSAEKRGRRGSSDSESGAERSGLPLQGRVSGTSYTGGYPPRSKSEEERFLGLRVGTKTAVSAERGTGVVSIARPSSAVISGGPAMGISVRREFSQKSDLNH